VALAFVSLRVSYAPNGTFSNIEQQSRQRAGCREDSFSETKGQSLGRPVGGYRFVGMPQGRVAWYSANLGHGFIIPDDRGPKPFVRREEIKAGEEETLENNDRVSYEVFEGPEGLEAKGISRVSEQ
jgi:cold shock protein